MKSTVNFYHVVYFWLKEPNNPEVRTQFRAHLDELMAGVDEIDTCFIGEPAGTDRPVIDGSFSFSWILTFKSREDQDTYQTHPAHLAFVEKAEHLWERVVVYDSVPA